MAVQISLPDGTTEIIRDVTRVEDYEGDLCLYDEEFFVCLREKGTFTTWEIVTEPPSTQDAFFEEPMEALEPNPDLLSRPVLGKDIKWETVERFVFKYESHVSQATVLPNGKIRSLSVFHPYAVIMARAMNNDDGEFPEWVSIPVTNRVDFSNLWKLEQQDYTNTDRHLILIQYRRFEGILGKLGGIMPRLEYSVYNEKRDLILIVYELKWNDKPWEG